MLVYETAKFRNQRERLAGGAEKEALKKAVLAVIADPATEKKLLGDLAGLRHFHFLAADRPIKLIYKLTADSLVFMSFGPRHTIVKS